MEPDADNINGLIFAGCFDNKIRVYDPLSSEPKSTYSGHGETVCSLAVNKSTQTLVSGSWDKTVKYWRGEWGKTEKKCTRTVNDTHQGSVLGIQITEEDHVVSACADKIIRHFDEKANLVKVLKDKSRQNKYAFHLCLFKFHIKPFFLYDTFIDNSPLIRKKGGHLDTTSCNCNFDYS